MYRAELSNDNIFDHKVHIFKKPFLYSPETTTKASIKAKGRALNTLVASLIDDYDWAIRLHLTDCEKPGGHKDSTDKINLHLGIATRFMKFTDQKGFRLADNINKFKIT